VILVTGATGMIGKAVVRKLEAHGAAVRALSRNAGQAESIFGPSVECVAGTYDDEASLKTAMDGVERVFVLCPIDPRLSRWEGNVVSAARSADVGHIVKLSTAGVEWVGQAPPVPTLWALHRESEQQIERAGLPFTHLRPDACMQNLLMFAAPIATGVYPAPTGEGQRAWIDVRDVADAAAVVLTEGGHEGRSYELTGPEALSDDDVAAKISAAIGTEVRHVNPPLAVARQNMLDGGMPDETANMISEVMVAIAAGRAGKVTLGIADLMGRAPRSMDAFLLEFRSTFVRT
jgi:uncharacterized protein YbjT (DUF2867 family)